MGKEFIIKDGDEEFKIEKADWCDSYFISLNQNWETFMLEPDRVKELIEFFNSTEKENNNRKNRK